LYILHKGGDGYVFYLENGCIEDHAAPKKKLYDYLTLIG